MFTLSGAPFALARRGINYMPEGPALDRGPDGRREHPAAGLTESDHTHSAHLVDLVYRIGRGVVNIG